MVTRPALEESVLEEIRPGAGERELVRQVGERLVKYVNKSGIATGMIVGSVARDTWIRGDRDLDIFMLFPPDLSREELEEQGLRLARSVADSEGGPYYEKYAEHPYIHATIKGLWVDIVPCYGVQDASSIQSAVDRTPFHTRYTKERIGPYADDVLLLKQFMKNNGVYGSDQMTEGFSGYLCELLILHYRGFARLIDSAQSWHPGICIDIEGHRSKDFSEPLVVVDPVDPGRNVSASVSLTKLCEFIELARGYREDPGREFFFLSPGHILDYPEFEEEIGNRGTSLYAIYFGTPPYIEEIVVPQLRKSLGAICSLLTRHEFVINRAAYEMHEKRSVFLLELLVDTLPPVKRHQGPPVWAFQNAGQFSRKYLNTSSIRVFSGPYIENGIYIVELERTYRTAADLLRSGELLGTGLGRHIREVLSGTYSVATGVDCYDEEFSEFISSFLGKTSPYLKIQKQRMNNNPV
ncbi:MAG TPA: CCA tRNA nucleotidyltransferase [Methanoregulaceae archaeon]|nr:CCA tRNA nucleotidyltransferase [Methanoregulaceae archaeon]